MFNPEGIPAKEQQEESETSPLEFWTEKGIDEALERVKEKFEDGEDREDKDGILDFHNTKHSGHIVKRVERILSAMKDAGAQITERNIARGKIYGAFHDIVQDESEARRTPEGNFEKVTRVRRTGDNEKASSEAAQKFMRRANEEAGEEIFTKEDIEGAEEAINATVPSFDFVDRDQGTGGTVIQPNLHKDSSFEARALAFADIGAAGMEGYEVFGPEGDAVFREENLDISRTLRKPEELSEEQKEYIKGRMIGWSRIQVGFSEGRKHFFEKELEGLDPAVQSKLKDEVFNKFDDSIGGAKRKLEERKNMPFEELARDMRYSL